MLPISNLLYLFMFYLCLEFLFNDIKKVKMREPADDVEHNACYPVNLHLNWIE